MDALPDASAGLVRLRAGIGREGGPRGEAGEHRARWDPISDASQPLNEKRGNMICERRTEITALAQTLGGQGAAWAVEEHPGTMESGRQAQTVGQLDSAEAR